MVLLDAPQFLCATYASAPQRPQAATMTLVKPLRQDERNGTLSSLNAAIGTLDLAGEAALTTPVKVVSSPVRILLATIRVSTPQPV